MNKSFIPFTEKEERLIQGIVDKRVKAQKKFPFLAAAMAAFGLQATFYGFEKLMDRVHLFTTEPGLVFLGGILILAASGTIYKVTN